MAPCLVSLRQVSALQRVHLRDATVAGVAALLPLAFSAALNSAYWTLRAALMLVVIALGVPAIPLAWRRNRVGTALGLGFIAFASCSTVLSNRPLLALFGAYGQGTGLLFIVGLVTAWALGYDLADRGRLLLTRGIVLAAAVNAGMAVAQRLADLTPFGVGLYQGQAHGLLGNPVHLAALLVGAMGLLSTSIGASRFTNPLALLFGLALELTGTRFGVLVALVMCASVVLSGPRDRRRWLYVALIIAGFALAEPLVAWATPSNGRFVGTTTHVAMANQADYSLRLATWRSAVNAVEDHPLFGKGPNLFAEATGRYRPLTVGRDDPERAFSDAHDLVVEYFVCTGILGGVAFLAFGGYAICKARGGFRLFALGVLAIYLIEPQHVVTLILAFLALGAGQADDATHESLLQWNRARAAGAAGLTALALLTGGGLIATDVQWHQAELTGDVPRARRVAGALAWWPEPHVEVGKLASFKGVTGRGDRAALREAIAAYATATGRDPDRAAWWTLRANLEFIADDTGAADAHFRRALINNPWSLAALGGLARVANHVNDQATVAEAFAQAQKVKPTLTLGELLNLRPEDSPKAKEGTAEAVPSP